MFNEAFWFFYWVGVVDTLPSFFNITALLCTIGAALSFPLYYVEDIKGAKKWHYLGPLMVLALALASIFTPTEKAMYAGATYYVVEAVELDDTLIQLKSILDDKIIELTGEDND